MTMAHDFDQQPEGVGEQLAVRDSSDLERYSSHYRQFVSPMRGRYMSVANVTDSGRSDELRASD